MISGSRCRYRINRLFTRYWLRNTDNVNFLDIHIVTNTKDISYSNPFRRILIIRLSNGCFESVHGCTYIRIKIAIKRKLITGVCCHIYFNLIMLSASEFIPHIHTCIIHSVICYIPAYPALAITHRIRRAFIRS